MMRIQSDSRRVCPRARRLAWLGFVLLAVPASAAVDHSLFDQLLNRHVNAAGGVDYAALQRDEAQLDAYLDQLARLDLDALSRDEQLAALINAYNAATLKLILDYYPIESIRDIPEDKRWKHARWNIGGNIWSLDQIEHEQIRPRFQEPRIHWVLVCAAYSCPPLRREAFVADRLDQQLEAQSRLAHQLDRLYQFKSGRNQLYLTQLYDWFREDFLAEHRSVATYAAQYDPALRQYLQRGGEPGIVWLDYDWSLNSAQRLPAR